MVDSDVGWGWSVVDSSVGWGVEVGVIDSVVGKRSLVRVMFDELAGGSVVEIGEARERQQVSQRINERLQILKYTILLYYCYIFQAFIH